LPDGFTVAAYEEVAAVLIAEFGVYSEVWDTGGGVLALALPLARYEVRGAARRYALVTYDESWIVGFYDDGPDRGGDDAPVVVSLVDPLGASELEVARALGGMLVRLGLRTVRPHERHAKPRAPTRASRRAADIAPYRPDSDAPRA
jgi:hypothetical protein